MNNPFDYTPDAACDAAFRKLTERLEELKRSDKAEDINFYRELEAGKMLGVLLAEDADGESHTLFAFSGQIGDRGFYFPGFVGPVFDYLQPDGYFKTKETDISCQNIEIARFQNDQLAKTQIEY
ncbi:MAG: RluA family pseudouridine synthase, partial [Muribaculaceae bacterium]|nr:RluA family pseudouridine synthase [Muribaculaceae bacterium]